MSFKTYRNAALYGYGRLETLFGIDRTFTAIVKTLINLLLRTVAHSKLSYHYQLHFTFYVGP